MSREPKVPLYVPRRHTKLGNPNIADRILFRANANVSVFSAGHHPFRMIEIQELGSDWFQMSFAIQCDDQETMRKDLVKWFDASIITGLPFSAMFFDFACRGWSETATIQAFQSDHYEGLRGLYWPREFDLPKNVAPGDTFEYFREFFTEDDLYHYSLVGFDAMNKAMTYPMHHDKYPILHGCEYVYRVRFKQRTSFVVTKVDIDEVEI